MVKLLNLVKVNIATTGTGTVTFGSAFSNAFFTPSEAGAADGDSVSYVLVEGDDTEIGTGVIGSSVTTMTRTVLKSKIGGVAGTTKMTLGGTAWLAFTALDRDISVPANNLSDVASAATSRTNIRAFGKVAIQKFTASGTYTPNAKLVYAVIECVGGGGGGGGATSTAGKIAGGGGGGGGETSRKIVTPSDIGASQTVTIGSGGGGGAAGNNAGSNGNQTSVGTLCIAKPGVGGGGAADQTSGTGSAGGSGGTGDVTIPGQAGGAGMGGNINSIAARGGMGGGTLFGFGAAEVAGISTNGAAGGNYGGGGGGGLSYNGGSNAAGGAGAPGLVVITEYCSE